MPNISGAAPRLRDASISLNRSKNLGAAPNILGADPEIIGVTPRIFGAAPAFLGTVLK